MSGSENTLGDFIAALEREGQVHRVTERVSPLDVPAAISVAEALRPAPPSADAQHFDPARAAQGGRVLVFEQVEGCDVPLAMNIFGSYKRVEHALGGPLEPLASRIGALVHMAPPRGMIDALRRLPDLVPVMRAGPRTVRKGVCQEIVHLTDRGEVDLARLPLIRCWPLDGNPQAVGWPMTAEQAGTASGQGRYITLAGMHTIHADDRDDPRPSSHNIGMYRAQLLGPTRLAMHWHLHHDGARHWRSWKRLGEPMPIAIALGGEPVLPWAATAPLPPGMSELLMAGFVNGRGIPLVPCVSVPLRVPANSEIVIEGFVRTDAGEPGWDPHGDEPLGDGAVLEGPFGDHTGYYSLPDRYPVMEVTAVTRRHNAIFPATVVGPPPQEDYYLGKATERVFRPPLQMLIPDMEDYHLPLPGCFHNWAVLAIRKAYALQARRVMHAVWGAGQMAWTKCVMVVDADEVDVHDEEAVMRAVFTHVDFARDVERVRGPLDILDHAAPELGAGGKIGFDATGRMAGEAAGTGTTAPPDPADLSAVADAVSAVSLPHHVPEWGLGRCVLVAPTGDAPDRGANALDAVSRVLSDWNGLIIAVDEEVDLHTTEHVWFHALACADPARDVRIVGGRMTIDATSRVRSEGDGTDPVRAWPPFLGWHTRAGSS